MEEVFASPAKRQKVCADPGIDAGFHSTSKAVASRLKGAPSSMTTTPQKLRQQAQRGGEALLHTPDGKALSAARGGGASADDGLLNLSPQLLAPNLMVLNQILGALYVTLPMVRSRGKAATYQNMRGPVQNFCGRDFQVIHVQQIKALCPEALGWEHIMAFNPATKRQEQQLVLAMPKPPADTAALQQEFFQRLQQHQAAAGAKVAELELPLAALPPAAGPNARDCTPTRQRGASGLLPSTPQTAPPAGNVAQLLLSPPAKRLATASRVSAASAADSGLMSPPPARTRGSARARLAAAPGGNGAAAGGGFSFSPAPRQPDLLSPRGGSSMGSFGTPVKSVHEPAAAAANVDASGRTPALRPNRLFADSTPIATATPQQPSAARPNTHSTPEAAGEGGSRAAAAAAGGVKVRKLTFDAAAPSAVMRASRAAKAAVAAAASAPASSKPEGSTAAAAAAAAVEAPKTKSGITFELGASAMALLQQVSSAEVKQEAADERAALDKQRALDMLPSSFDALRAVFGERGPCVKPRTEVVELLRQKSTCKGGMSRADAAEQVDLMQRLVPEFVRTVTASGASLAAVTQSVRVNRQLGWPAARHKLMAAAAEARAGGCAAAAAAVELEEQAQRERQAAAAAAASEGGAQEAAAGESGDEVSDSEEELVIEGRPAVDELGLDILAHLDGGGSANDEGGCGGCDILGLLGGGGRAGAMPAAVVGALAFKAPPPRRAAAAAKKA